MNRRTILRMALIFGLVGFGMSSGGCRQEAAIAPPKVDDHPPASPSLLADKRCTHRKGEGKFEFEWQFNGPEFEIRGASIPTDLLMAFTGSETPVTNIRGQWTLQGRKIFFTDLTISGVPVANSQVQMIVYSAGTIRIQSPAAIYTF